MRSAKVSGAALLALGVGTALWLWRNPQARTTAQRALGGARSRLREAGIAERLGQWLPTPFTRLVGRVLEPEHLPGVLNLEDQNLTITQRVRTKLGREPALASVPHFNVNTEGEGIVYLRGYVHTEEQRRAAELVASATEGARRIVNELNIQRAVNL